jgi:hypothetical protein
LTVKVMDLTNGLPREVGRLLLQCSVNVFGEATSAEMTKYNKSASEYYQERFRRLLSKNVPDLLKESLKFAGLMYLGAALTEAPDSWIDAGMLLNTNGHFTLPCPAAKPAFWRVFSHHLPEELGGTCPVLESIKLQVWL